MKQASAFLLPLRTENLDDEYDILVERFLYYSAHLGRAVEVEKGFITNYSSVPRMPVAYWLFGGVGKKPAVIHDKLYSPGSDVSRKDADEVFSEACKVAGISAWKRGPMWLAVRLFGGAHYKAAEQS